jgi:hypothetical protein
MVDAKYIRTYWGHLGVEAEAEVGVHWGGLVRCQAECCHSSAQLSLAQLNKA